VVVFLASTALAGRAAAQDSTAELLARARAHYERLEVEQALPLFRQVTSPQWTAPVTPEQRAEAFKYIGATLVIMGRADSGAAYFQAALARDPFADLDPRVFTPAQIAAFTAARQTTFAVGVRPVPAARVDLSVDRIHFTIVTTHSADVTVRLSRVDSSSAFAILQGGNDGVRDVVWDGLTPGGAVAASGRYALDLVAVSRLLSVPDSVRTYFDLRVETGPLEDTLPALSPGSFLPEHRSQSGARADLVKGLALAGGVLFLSDELHNDRLTTGGDARPMIVASAAAVTGIAAFIAGRGHSRIDANVAANQRVRTARDSTNAAVRGRNRERLAHPVLRIGPAGGAARP
jgi:hypothetical protein